MAKSHQRHISERDLILAANGELSAKERAGVEQHLAECWQCRHGRSAIERAIEGFMAIRSRQLPSELPPSESKIGQLEARLAAVTAQPPPLWLGLLKSLGLSLRAHRSAWVAAISAVCLALVFVAVFHPAVVTAEVLVSKASAAQSSSSVNYQELRIQVDNQTYHRRVLRGGARPISHEQPSPQIAGLLREAGIDWGNPLSAEAFSAWRAGAQLRQDRVRRDRDHLTLTTETPESGPVREAALTVRATDFWPIAATWRFHSGNVIEIVELSSSTKVPADLLPGAPVPEINPPAPVANAASIHSPEPAAPLLPRAEELAAAELAARTALHNIGADLGEDVTIQRTARDVQVRVRVETEARKQEIARALGPVSLLATDARTFSEASAADSLEPSSPAMVILAAPRPLLADELAARFPDPEARREFVNRALALSEQAVHSGFALKNLADRYSPAEMALLDPAGRQTLELLVSAHIDSLDRDLTTLASHLQPLSIQGQSAAGVPAGVNAPLHRATDRDESGSPADWRRRASDLTSRISDTHKLLVQSLSGGGGYTITPESAKQQIAAYLAMLPAQLLELRHQLSEDFSERPNPGLKE